MALILISRGSFSGGQVIAQCLHRTAGMTCLTREDLITSVNRQGQIATKVTAAMAKAAQNYGEFSALRRPYKILMRLALLEYARQASIAYFGYSGHLLLQGISHALRVRIIAPMELRAKLMMNREKLTEEEARDRVREFDEERRRWTRFMYGKTLGDPQLFDLCINLERMSFPAACCTMLHVSRESDFCPTPESLAEVENQYLSTRVLAALINDQRSYEFEISANADAGRIILQGPYLEETSRSIVLDIVRAVPGVQEVQYTEGYETMPDFIS